MNYFELLNLSPTFGLDLTELEKAYFRTQREFHPDRFVGRPDDERQKAAQHSADINSAYHILKDPLERARYLLKLQGIKIGTDNDTVKPSHDILLEAMELREDPPAPDALKKMIESSIATISDCYTKAAWDDMAQETLRLGYLMKTVILRRGEAESAGS